MLEHLCLLSKYSEGHFHLKTMSKKSDESSLLLHKVKSISCSNTSRNNETKFLCSSVPGALLLPLVHIRPSLRSLILPGPTHFLSRPFCSGLGSWGFVSHGLFYQPLLQRESLILSRQPPAPPPPALPGLFLALVSLNLFSHSFILYTY